MTKRFGFEIERCNNYGREMTCSIRLFQMAHAYKNSVTMQDVKDAIEYTVKSDGFKDELGVLAERITKDIIESYYPYEKSDAQLDDVRRGVVEIDKYSIYGSPVYAEYHFIAVMVDRHTWFLNKATGEIKRYLDLEYILSKTVDDNARRASIISDAIYMVNRCLGGGVEFAITEFNNGIEYKNIETLVDSLKRFKNYFNISDETLISLVKEGILLDGFSNNRCNDETHYYSEQDKEVALMIKALNTLLDLPEVEAEVAPANVKDERDGLIEAGFTWERYKSTARISDNTVNVVREQVIKAVGDCVEGIDNIRKAIEFGRGVNGHYEELAEYLLDNNFIPEGASYICKMTIKGSPNYCNFFYEAIGIDSKYYLYDVWNKKFSTQLNIDDIYASRDVQQPWFNGIKKVIEISGFDKNDPTTIFDNVEVSSETVEEIAENGDLRSILRGLGFEYDDQKLDEIIHNIVIKLQKAEQEIDIFGEEEAVTEDETVVSPQKVIIGVDVEAANESEIVITKPVKEEVKEMINDKNLLIGAGIPSETAQMMLEYATMGEGMRDWFKIGDVDVCNRVSFSTRIYDDGFCEVIKIHELAPYEEDDVITGWDNIREAIEYYDGKYKEYGYAFKEIANRIEDDGDLPESVSFIDKKLIRLRSGQVFPVVEIDGRSYFFVPEVYGVTWSEEPLTSDRVKIEVEWLLDWIRSDIADSIAYGVIDESGQEIDLFGSEEDVTEDEAATSPQKMILGDDALSISRFDDQIMVDKYHKPLGMLAEMTGACGIALIDKDPISGDDIKGVVSCEDPQEIMSAYQLIVDKKYNHIKFLSAWEMQKWEELDDSLQESIKAESPICLYDETLEGHTDFCKKKGGFVRSIEECIDFEPIPEASSYEWSLLEGIIGERITREEIKKNEYYKDLIVSKLGEIKRVFGGWSNMVSDLRSLVLS